MPSLPDRLLFLGLGGAGQRHMRIFREMLPDAEFVAYRRTGKTPLLNPDFSVVSSDTLENRYGVQIVDDLDAAYAQNPDLVVVGLPSSMHAATITDALDRGISVFSEKPGATSYEQATAIRKAAKTAGAGVFVSFQRRFHPLVAKLKDIVDSGLLGDIMSVQVNVASHVPDWHPYEDFRELYACRADLGGGVLRTECHELDILMWTFGAPARVTCDMGCRGPHQLDVPDTAEMILHYGNFGARVSLCFMQRRQQRSISIAGQNGWIECDLLTQTLEFGQHDKPIRVFDDGMDMDDQFRQQAKFFLNEFKTSDNRYIQALENLTSLFNAAEKSSASETGIRTGA
jgi:predicted dehydrogenase